MLDPERFTYARVAERAGVSERTVYRTFPTKRDLTRAFIEDVPLTLGRPMPETTDEMAGFLRDLTRLWGERLGDTSPPPTAAQDPEGLYPEASEDRMVRDDAVRRAIDPLLSADLPPAQRDGIVAVLRLVFSLRMVLQSAGRYGLTLAEAGEAHAWAFSTLINALRTEEVPPWPSDQSSP